MANASAKIDVKAWLEEVPFGRYQFFILFLCFLALLIDGFDAQVIAVAAPSLKERFGVDSAQMGALLAGGTLGGAIAGFMIAPFSDRIGRRPLMAGSLCLSGLLTLCYLVADNLPQLLAIRVSCGFLLAVAVSVTFAYSAEITARRIQVRSVIFANTGFGIGVALSGFVGGWMIPTFGWQSVFVAGGGLTMLIGVVFFLILPESPRYLALRGNNPAQLRKTLSRINRANAPPPEAEFILQEEQKPGLSLRHLLGEGRATPVLALFAMGFMINVVVWVLMQWLPTFVKEAQGDISQAGETVGWFKIGGMIGSLICAYLVDRWRNPYPFLTLVLLASVGGFLILAGIDARTLAFLVAVFLVGMLISGIQYTQGGLLARTFPTYVRMAGLGINGGINRIGAMTGPLIVGFLKQAGWSNTAIFQIAVLPLLLCALACLFLAVLFRHSPSEPNALKPAAANAT